MKKKLLVTLSTLCLSLCLALGLTACKKGGNELLEPTVKRVTENGITYVWESDYVDLLHNAEDGYIVTGVTDKTITKIAVPSSVNGFPVTGIGGYAFEDCTALASITLPDSVMSIRENAFKSTAYYQDDNNWENDVLYIGNYLIKAKSSLADDYTIKDGTKAISKSAFENCKSLTGVTIPDSVKCIEQEAFLSCTSLASIAIGNGVTRIGSSAFADTAYYKDDNNWENDVLYIGNYLIKATPSLEGKYTIKNGTKAIAHSAFRGCSSLTSITIPNSVTSIGRYTFKDCTSLTSIAISNKATSIGRHMFEGCTSLASVTIPNSVKSIGNNAFYGCTSLTSVSIGKSVVMIGDEAFSYCTKLTSVTIPDSVQYVGDLAFMSCTSLENISMGNGVTRIGSYAFALTAYYNDGNNWKDGALYLGKSLIQVNSSQTGNFTIKNGTKVISGSAFFNCAKLTGVTIPGSVKSIGRAAFSGCTALDKITIPNGVTDIEQYSFSGCTALTSVTIPNSVKSIGKSAFDGCTSLASVTIPNSVKSIGDSAFYGCTSLADITFSGTKAAWEVIPKDENLNWNACDYTVHCTDGDITKE